LAKLCPEKTTVSRKTKKEKETRRRKRTALIICRDRKQFWTTQTQFWQWIREGVAIKLQDNPLTGAFLQEDGEMMVLLSHTILNLSHRNHLREALLSRRNGLAGKRKRRFSPSKSD
jgi:hypothetical protein